MEAVESVVSEVDVESESNKSARKDKASTTGGGTSSIAGGASWRYSSGIFASGWASRNIETALIILRRSSSEFSSGQSGVVLRLAMNRSHGSVESLADSPTSLVGSLLLSVSFG